MTRKEVFEKIANAYLTPIDDRTDTQRKLANTGICHALDCHSLNSFEAKLINWIKEYNPKWFGCYGGKTGWGKFRTPADDKDRGWFCLFISQLSEKEFWEVVATNG